jgi:hypothetical protein
MDNINTADLQGYNLKWAYTAIVVIVVWFSLVLQFSISIPAYQATGHTTVVAVLQIFSFFTILTNLLAVISLTVLLLKPLSAWGRFFSKSSVLGAITVYIAVVGIIYALLLRQLWHPEGWFKLADELLHTVNPLLFIIYWLTFAPKSGLRWKQCLIWLWYPFIYFIYVLIRGAISGEYPYPFMNVETFGYIQVTINSLVILLVFAVLGLLIIWAGKLLNKDPKPIKTS